MRAAAAVLTALAAAAASAAGGGAGDAGRRALFEAWLPAFLLWTGLGVGALGILAIGQLLREDWLRPVRAPLEAAARTLPLSALMAIPELVGLDALYPWAAPEAALPAHPRAAWLQPWPFRVRAVAFLALWAGLGLLLARPGRRRRSAALALAALLPTVTLAAQDWALSRDPAWFGSLQGFAIWVDGLAAALAAAILAAAALRREPAEDEALTGLERALLTLALAVAWLWFTQFIVVWMADLPAEAGWYLRRAVGGWAWLELGVALPALLLAIALAAPPDHGQRRMAAVCVLLLVQHLAHLWWVVRPEAPDAARPPAWLDLAVTLGLGAAWALWWGGEIRRRRRRRAALA